MLRMGLWLAFALVLEVACENRVTCAFKWAQNAEFIFIFAKYSHKIDAPAPNNIKLGDVKIEDKRISISAAGFRAGAEVLYDLDITLLKHIDVEQSVSKPRTLGVEFKLKKSDSPSNWGRLLETTSPPKSMHRWWELWEKYETELGKVNSGEYQKQKDEAFWEPFEHKCESCRAIVDSTVFGQTKWMEENAVPQGDENSRDGYAKEVVQRIGKSCDSLPDSVPKDTKTACRVLMQKAEVRDGLNRGFIRAHKAFASDGSVAPLAMANITTDVCTERAEVCGELGVEPQTCETCKFMMRDLQERLYRSTVDTIAAELAAGTFCTGYQTRYNEPASTSLTNNCLAMAQVNEFTEKLTQAMKEGKLLKNLCFLDGSRGADQPSACRKKSKKKKKKKAKKEEL